MRDFVDGEVHQLLSGARRSRDECDQEAADRVAALTAYVKTLDPPTTAFDEGQLSPAAKAGEKLFQGKGGCIECHGGPLFTDNLIHNTGVPQVQLQEPLPGPVTPNSRATTPARRRPPADAGVHGDPPARRLRGASPGAGSAFINTPQLRDLKATAPYMHNGVFKTLEEVVQFYNSGSSLGPLSLSAAEVQQLVAYLESL